MASFTFNLTLLASINVEARSREEAETRIRNMVESEDVILAGQMVTLQIEGELDLDEDADSDGVREIVFTNLDAAVENGYYEPIESFSPEQIAVELTAFAEDCQDAAVHLLVPHVKAWIAQRKQKAAA